MLHASLPFRISVSGHQGADEEIALHDTHSVNGQVHANEPVRVYDTSGPWGDPEFTGLVTEGLPATRDSWVHARGDVEAYEGRKCARETMAIFPPNMPNRLPNQGRMLRSNRFLVSSENHCVPQRGTR